MNRNSFVRDVSDAFGMRSVAMRNEFNLLKITASAAPRVPN
jgi:hypothetical protein